MRKFFLSIVFLLSQVTVASAQVAGKVTETGGFATLDQLGIVFANVVGIVSTIAGFASLTMILIGGFRYIFAQGDPKAVGQARLTITWAVAGLVFVVASFLIVQFIAGFVSLPGVGRFCIPLVPTDCSLT
jgi:hypothetical protein